MSDLIALITGRGLPPPPKVGAGRVIYGRATGPDDDTDDDGQRYTCRVCQASIPGDGYYWRKRSNGRIVRYSACKKCHVAAMKSSKSAHSEAK